MRIQTRPHSVYLSENLSKNYKIINSPPSPGGTIDSGFYSINGNNDDKQSVFAIEEEEEEIDIDNDNNDNNNSINNNNNKDNNSSSSLTEKNNYNLNIYNKFHTIKLPKTVIRDRRSLPAFNNNNNTLIRHSSLRGVGETEKTEKSLPVIDMSELTKKWSDWFEPSVLDWLNETKNLEIDIKLNLENNNNNTNDDNNSNNGSDRTIGSRNIYESSLPSPPPKAHSKDDGNNTENDKKSIRYSDAPSIRLRSTGRPFSLQSIQSILSGNPEEVSDNESDDEDGEEVINHMKITIDSDGDDDTNSNITSETMTPSTYLAKVIEGETVTRHYYNRDIESNINNNNNLSPYDATNKKSTDLESIVLSTEFSEKSHETINVKPDNNDKGIITNNEDPTIISKYLFWSGFLIFPLWWLGSFYLPKSATPATPEDYKWRSRCRKATFYSSTGVTIIIIVLLAIFLI